MAKILFTCSGTTLSSAEGSGSRARRRRRRCRSPCGSRSLSDRCRMILRCADGLGNKAVAAASVSRSRVDVRLWRRALKNPAGGDGRFPVLPIADYSPPPSVRPRRRSRVRPRSRLRPPNNHLAVGHDLQSRSIWPVSGMESDILAPLADGSICAAPPCNSAISLTIANPRPLPSPGSTCPKRENATSLS